MLIYKQKGLGDTLWVERRRRGYYESYGNEFYRQDFLSGNNIVFGRETRIAFTIDKVVPARYAIIDADSLQPSHIQGAANPLHFLPEIQPRNRTFSPSGAKMPEEIAHKLRPEEITEGATAYVGAPVINARGEIIQGNGRGYTLLYYYSLKPDGGEYKNFLKKNLACFGLSSKSITQFKKPVLIRLTQLNDTEAILFGQYQQKDLEAVSSDTTNAKAVAGKVPDEAFASIIADLMRKDMPDATLSELIRVSRAMQILVRYDVLRQDEVLEKYTTKGTINAEGVKYITNLLLFKVFKSNQDAPDLFHRINYQIQQAVIKSVLYIASLPQSSSISQDFSDAVLLINEFYQASSTEFNAFLRQIDITGKSAVEQYKPEAIAIAKMFLTEKTQKNVVERFKRYNVLTTGAPPSLTEPNGTPALSKKQAFLVVFGEFMPKTQPQKKVFELQAQARKRKLLLA